MTYAIMKRLLKLGRKRSLGKCVLSPVKTDIENFLELERH
jgi:hypothetical protein